MEKEREVKAEDLEKREKLPNFFIVGAAKSGTTSLYHHLCQHPDIFMSPAKEPGYFSREKVLRINYFPLYPNLSL